MRQKQILTLAGTDMTETAYRRASIDTAHIYYTEERIEEGKSSPSEPAAITAQKNWVGRMAIFSGTYTEESLMFLRPCGLVLLPAVSWAVLVFSVTVGFLVTITTFVLNLYAYVC